MDFNLYTDHYKRLLVVPLALVFLLAYVAFVSPGLLQGLDIQGGTLLLIQTDQPVSQAPLESLLREKFDLVDLKVTATSFGVRIQFANSAALLESKELLQSANEQLAFNPAQAKQSAIASAKAASRYFESGQDLSVLESEQAVLAAQDILFQADEAFGKQLHAQVLDLLSIDPTESRLQKKEIGAALGQLFWENALNVTLIGMLGIAIVVFVFFRELIPSIAIILAALFDILAALAFMAFFQIPLSLSSIPALLMLIGYSIDTDILLTTRILRKKGGSNSERAMDSLKTGMTMTLTALAAVLIMVALSFVTGITLIFEIGAVLVGGLLGDIIVTWLANAPIVLWYAEYKASKKQVMI